MRYTKQLITVSLLMGLALNSCTNDDNAVSSQQAPTVILFSASPYRLESKAIHTESTMPTDLPIGIYGWGHKLGQTAHDRRYGLYLQYGRSFPGSLRYGHRFLRLLSVSSLAE